MAAHIFRMFGSRAEDGRRDEFVQPWSASVMAPARSPTPPRPQHTESVSPPAGRDEAAGSTYERRHADQALAQEQTVFERKLQKDDAMFKLQITMGWATVAIIPVSAAAIFLDPAAAVGLVPLNGLAAWNWRRTLMRNDSELEAITKPPATLP